MIECHTYVRMEKAFFLSGFQYTIEGTVPYGMEQNYSAVFFFSQAVPIFGMEK